MCRQYNNYGSANRDMEEGNLNSLNFSDFCELPSSHTQSKDPNEMATDTIKPVSQIPTQAMEDQLMKIAEFERSSMQLALQYLTQVTSAEIMERFKVLVGVTDLFGQLYIQVDLTNRIQAFS